MIFNVRQQIDYLLKGYRVLLILLNASIFLSSCYATEKSYGVAHIYRHKTDYFEIQIPYKIKGRGSLHNFTFEKYEGDAKHYLIFNHYQKIIIADSLRLIYEKGYSAQSDLKGNIILSDSSLVIDLKLPNYNNRNEVKRWSKYKFNGFYKLDSIGVDN